MRIRQQLDRHTGQQIVHCHILDHEDKGMMNIIDIVGKEGTTWPGARNVDPTCQMDGEPIGAPTVVEEGTCKRGAPCATDDDCGTETGGLSCVCSPAGARRRLLFGPIPAEDCQCDY